jgi:exodeoxyribonuclease VII small subunit
MRHPILHNSKVRLTPASIAAKPRAMSETAPEITAMTFEEALRALEDVVRKLESGDVALEESITLYERGEQLRRHCQARLDAAQARIEKIVQGPDGRPTGTAPFDAQ